MNTDEMTNQTDTQPAGENWWMDGILGRPSADPGVNNMRDAAANRVDEMHAALANHFEETMAASGSARDQQYYKKLSSNLIVSAALNIHRETHPEAHSALMSACLSTHPDLEDARERLFSMIDKQKKAIRDLRCQRTTLLAVCAVLVVVACLT